MAKSPILEDDKPPLSDPSLPRSKSLRSSAGGSSSVHSVDEGRSKGGFLKVGDIIFLKSQAEVKKENGGKDVYQVFLSSDGILSTSVECIPKIADNVRVKGANVMTRRCLFRIENARSTMRKDTSDHDIEYSIVSGKPFTYGEHIQLRHFHSHGLLEVRSMESAREQGCLQVCISPKSSDFTWFEVLPVNKLRQQGERIKYSDSIYLRAVGLKTNSYLHTYSTSSLSTTDKLEVNCGPEQWEWKPRRYMDYGEMEGEGRFVTTSNSFRVYHRVAEGYLVAPEVPIFNVDLGKEVCVYVERGNKTSSSLWELQRSAVFRGGKARWRDVFRFKHLATGLFLSSTGELISDGISLSDQALIQFVIHPDEDTTQEFATFGSMVRLQSVATGMFIIIPVATGNFDSQGKFKDQSQGGNCEIRWTNGERKRDYPYMAFCIEDVSEIVTDHIYKLGLMTPAITDFSQVVKMMGTSSKSSSDVQFFTDRCSSMENVLTNILHHIILSTDGKVDVFKRQDSMREMGIIDAFMDLAKEIDAETKKFKVTRFLKARDKNTLKIVERFDLVEQHLLKVVHEGIKGNEKSSNRIRVYETYLLSKINAPEAGQLLKEVFRFVQADETMEEVRFQRWFQRPDREPADLTHLEMILCMHIIGSFCETMGRGIPRFQQMAQVALLEAQNEFPLVKFGMVGKKPCVELVFKTVKHAEAFLFKSPFNSSPERPFQNLSLVGRGEFCFLLEEFCKVPIFVKFLTAELLLFATVCLDRNAHMINSVLRELTLTSEHAESVLHNLFLPDKIRAAYARLYRVVFIDVEPFMSCIDNVSRCYQFEEGTLVKIRVRDGPENSYPGLGVILRRFWDYAGLISLDGQHLGQKLEMTASFLRLTHAAIELDVDIGEDKHRFVEDLLQPFGLLIMERVPTSQSKLLEHWCCKLMLEVRDARDSHFKVSLENKWAKVVFEVLLILEIVLKMRQDLHISHFLAKFKEVSAEYSEIVPWHETFPALRTEIKAILQRLNFDIKFKGQNKESARIEYVRSNSPETEILEKENSQGSAVSEEDAGVLGLDLHLLKLVFNVGKSRKKKIRKKALDIIIQNMNEKKLLKEQLNEVQFLIGYQMTAHFRRLIESRGRLVTDLAVLKEGKWQSGGQTDSLRHQRALESLNATILDTVGLMTLPEECKYQRTKLQDLMRLSCIYKELVQVLYLTYERDKHEEVFENTFDLLRLFTYTHKKNQSLMFEHKNRLLALMEFQEGGVTHLLTEVLRSYRDTEFGLEVIKYLFLLIEKHTDYPYRVLQLLRTFTRDENGGYIKNIQTDILKGIVSSSKIVNLHTTSVGALNYTQPQFSKTDTSEMQSLKLRFHQEVLRTLIACTFSNRFGLLQCRNLISANMLKKAIRAAGVNITSKKIYIRFLYQVHMTNLGIEIQAKTTINDIEFVLKDVTKDVKLCLEKIPLLLKTAITGCYDNIRIRISDPHSARPPGLTHGPSLPIPSGDEQANLAFWNYISGKETIHTEKDGVLHILRDLFSAYSQQGYPLTSEVERTKTELSSELARFESELQKEEHVNRDMDLSNLILVVNACREALPKQEAGRGGGMMAASEDRIDSEEGEEMAKLVVLIREYVLEKNMTLEQAFDLFDVDRDGNISITELKGVLRSLIHGGVREVDLDRAIQYLDTDGDGSIQFEEFTLKLKRYYGRRTGKGKNSQFKELSAGMFPQLKEKLTADQEADRRYKESLREFNEEFGNSFADVDIQPLITKINKEFVQPSQKRKDYTVFKEFISKLGVAFNKRIYKIYLIKMLRLLIKPQSDDTSHEDTNQIREIQIVLCEAGVLEMALEILSDVSDLELVNESVELLLAMLQGGNAVIQEQLLTILKRESDSNLFSYIRRQLRLSRDRIVRRADRLYEKNPEATLAEMMGETVESSSSVCDILTKDEEAVSNHVLSLLKLIQLCCENCYAEFQHYIRSQNEGNAVNRQLSIALVNEIAQYLVNLKEMGKLLRNDYEAAKVVPGCLEALVDLCKGPCLPNQQLLGTKKKLYQFIKSTISIDLRRTFGLTTPPAPSNPTEAQFFISSIRLLKALLEGEYDHKVAETMLSVIDFRFLAEKAKDIYELFVHDRLRMFMQNRFEGEVVTSRLMRILIGTFTRKTISMKSDDEKIIDLGFDICIIILKLRKEFPNEDLKWLNFSDQVPHSISHLDQAFFLKRIEAFKGRSESILHDVYYWAHAVWDRVKGTEANVPMMDLAYSFYLSLIGSVEIDKGGDLAQCYFRFPTMVTYMSSKLVQALLMDVNRNSHDEKIKSFFHKTEKYEVAMTHLRVMSRLRWLAAIASKRRFIEDVCFVMIVVMNVIMLFTISSADDASSGMSSMGSTAFLTAFAIILSILAINVYILYILENYPLIIYEKQHRPALEGAYENKALSKLRGTVLMKEMSQYKREVLTGAALSIWKKWFFIFFDQENVYNLAYVLISFAALRNPFFYSVLLLDIIRRSDDLVNILKAITENIRQLLLTLLLGVMIVFLFSVAGFLWFGEYYKNQLEEGSPKTTYCHTLFQCFTSVLDMGVRAGGGIGDVLAYPLLGEDGYWYRQIYDILFFIIVSIILLNIIFGIIIDTFAELRDKRKFIDADLKTVCFICGRKLFEFEYKGAGWNEHIQMEHNLYAYLSFIIYLRRKKLRECDGLEKFVKKKIAQNDVSFFPKTTKTLLLSETESDPEQSTLSSLKKDLQSLVSDLP